MPGDSGFAGLGNNNHHSSATRRRIPSDSSELQATGDSGAMATATTVESPRAGAGTGAGAGAMVAAPCVAAGPMAQAGAIKTSATASTTTQAPAGGAKARRAPSVAVAEIASALTSSAFLQSVAAARRDIMHSSRALTGDEVAALVAAGNTSFDPSFSNVRVQGSTFSVANVRGCSFNGQVVLEGTYDAVVELEAGVMARAGLYNTMFSNCHIGNNVTVVGTKLVANTVIRDGAVVLGCGIISCSGSTTFGNGVDVPLGLDGDGRNTACFAEITVAAAAEVACRRDRGSVSLQAAYAASMREYVAAATAKFTLIESGARLTCCPRITNAFVGHCAEIDSSELSNVTILSCAEEHTSVRGGSVVRDSLLQWGVHVDQMACVETAVMCEHSHADKHAKLLGSLLGPNSGVSEGEVSSSLVGPFVGFHHQALLIAAMWPAGKGNVGYGANVGSNHTGKAPDQELRPGEGVFFGLGTCIKFPSNFEESPYTIIATGSTTLPQRLSFPFSLINLPGDNIDGLSPAFNELFTGWVLSDSVFTVWRNQMKFQKRDKARRQRTDPDVFRPHNVDLMIDACKRLQAAKPARFKTPGGEAVYTDREVAGLGKNYLRESSRKKGIEAYTFYIRLYALEALFDALNAGVEPLSGGTGTGAGAGAGAGGGDGGADDAKLRVRWQHARGVLADQFGSRPYSELLSEYHAMLDQASAACEKSKGKDARRGVKIIPGYNDVHELAANDSVVRALKARAKRVGEGVATLIARL